MTKGTSSGHSCKPLQKLCLPLSPSMGFRQACDCWAAARRIDTACTSPRPWRFLTTSLQLSRLTLDGYSDNKELQTKQAWRQRKLQATGSHSSSLQTEEVTYFTNPLLLESISRAAEFMEFSLDLHFRTSSPRRWAARTRVRWPERSNSRGKLHHTCTCCAVLGGKVRKFGFDDPWLAAGGKPKLHNFLWSHVCSLQPAGQLQLSIRQVKLVQLLSNLVQTAQAGNG